MGVWVGVGAGVGVSAGAVGVGSTVGVPHPASANIRQRSPARNIARYLAGFSLFTCSIQNTRHVSGHFGYDASAVLGVFLLLNHAMLKDHL